MVSGAVVVSLVAAIAWLIWLSRDVEARIPSARWAGLFALALVPVWLALVIFYAPIEEAQGIIQKIFYVHTPAIIPTYAGFVLTAIGGVGYLSTRSERWDHLAVAGAEVGVVFCSLILIVAPLWAKPAWGHWWVWDLRLTTTLMLWFIYVAYVFLRSFAFGSDTSRTFTAIYGIAGIAAISFVYFAVDLAQGSTMHPSIRAARPAAAMGRPPVWASSRSSGSLPGSSPGGWSRGPPGARCARLTR
jgi:heme exporter protein C